MSPCKYWQRQQSTVCSRVPTFRLRFDHFWGGPAVYKRRSMQFGKQHRTIEYSRGQRPRPHYKQPDRDIHLLLGRMQEGLGGVSRNRPESKPDAQLSSCQPTRRRLRRPAKQNWVICCRFQLFKCSWGLHLLVLGSAPLNFTLRERMFCRSDERFDYRRAIFILNEGCDP